jgi:branched-chain amino acid transport system substrate-binding protein
MKETRSQRKTGRFAVTALAVGFLAFASGDAFANEVRVGAFIPATGAQADVGAQMRSGIEVALEHIQAKASGGPVTLKVFWYDDEAKADVALNAVTRALTVDKIDIGMGFLSSDVYVRVMDEFQKASVPVIACCAGSNKIGES